MILNYFKIAIRNFVKDKIFSFINIIGLAIGLACTIVIFIWVSNEFSYDKFHKNSDSLYRLISNYNDNNVLKKSAIHSVPLASTIKEEIPEIKYASRYFGGEGSTIIFNKTFYTDLTISKIDPDFFNMFSFELIQGDPNTLLNKLYSIVITESLASKIFGLSDPMGNILTIDEKEYEVTGIIHDIPKNSHFKMQAFTHFDTRSNVEKQYIPDDSWELSAYFVYIQLKKQAKISDVALKISQVVNSNTDRFEYEHNLQAIDDIYLFNEFDDYIDHHGSIKNIFIFISIAILILIIGGINYMNLSTAKFDHRSKEIALRKVLGANKKHLLWQFLFETSINTVISLIIAFILIESLRPILESVIGNQLPLHYLDPVLLLGITSIVIFTCLFAGLYPALFMSSFNITKLTKGIRLSKTKSKKNIKVRSSLIIFQSVLSISLITIIVSMFSQYRFVNSKDMGFDKENLIYFANTGAFRNDAENIRNTILSHKDISNVSFCNEPIKTNYDTKVECDKKISSEDLTMSVLSVDENFISTIKGKILDGNNFSKKISNKSNVILINEAAQKLLGFDETIGSEITYKTPFKGKKNCQIIGVVKDFHMESMHNKISPIIFAIEPFWQYEVCIRYKSQANIKEILLYLENIWTNYNPDMPFEYYFIEDKIEALYQNEKNSFKILNTFTIIAIIISLLGILGLTHFSIEASIKNIGIRKALGAPPFSISRLMILDVSKWLSIAFIISIPISYTIIHKWLESFAYRIEYPWWVIIAGALFIYLISMAIISYKVIKVSRMNPVNSLRYE